MDDLQRRGARAREGNLATEAEKLAKQNKLFVRDRLALLLDEGSFVEDGLLANALAPTDDLPADGVVTGVGRDRRPAGVRDGQRPDGEGGLVGRADGREDRPRSPSTRCATSCPSFWLVDSAGARITDQVELFPGRRGAGRIFANQVRLSGKVPQVCCLFGPSAAGGAYIPSFCDVVFMVEGNASMYLGSPRMAEVVIGETRRRSRRWAARGCTRPCQRLRRQPVQSDDADAIAQARRFFSYLPTTWRAVPLGVAPARAGARR